MSNPANLLLMRGTIASEMKFISNRMGEEFACEFKISVMRNYTNKGKQEYDTPLLRVEGVKRIPLLHQLGYGTEISISGAVQTRLFNIDGKQYEKNIIIVENKEVLLL